MSAILSSFKLISAKRQTNNDPTQFRRQKLSQKLQEQVCLATAYMNGTTYTAKRQRNVRDENGLIQTVEVQKSVKPWWFTASDNKVALTVRYGNRAIEFAKGKNAIEIADAKSLISTLEKLTQAVLDGQLDEQLAQASSAVKARFNK